MSSSVKCSSKPRAHDRQRQILVGAVVVDVAQRHGLDQRQVHAAAVRPTTRSLDLVLVDALQRHGVDLDLEAGRLRRVDAAQHLFEIAPAGDRLELLRVQRVERDVDPPDAGGLSSPANLVELAAVGGQRQLVERTGLEMAAESAETAS